MYIRIPIFLDCEQTLIFFKVAGDAPCLRTRRILREKTDCSQSTIFQVIWIFFRFFPSMNVFENWFIFATDNTWRYYLNIRQVVLCYGFVVSNASSLLKTLFYLRLDRNNGCRIVLNGCSDWRNSFSICRPFGKIFFFSILSSVIFYFALTW